MLVAVAIGLAGVGAVALGTALLAFYAARALGFGHGMTFREWLRSTRDAGGR